MAITTRLGKGSALSHAELDTNFTDLDTRSSDNDIRLTALEDDTLDARLIVLEGQTLDARLVVLETDTTNSDRLDVLEGQTLDTRLTAAESSISTLEGQTLDTRLTAAESSISTLEGDTLDARLDVLEGQNLDSRVTVLESLQYPGIDSLTSETTQAGSNWLWNFDVSSVHSASIDVAGCTLASIIFDNPVAGQKLTLFVRNTDTGPVNIDLAPPNDGIYGFNSGDPITNGKFYMFEVVYDGTYYWVNRKINEGSVV